MVWRFTYGVDGVRYAGCSDSIRYRTGQIFSLPRLQKRIGTHARLAQRLRRDVTQAILLGRCLIADRVEIVISRCFGLHAVD